MYLAIYHKLIYIDIHITKDKKIILLFSKSKKIFHYSRKSNK